MVAKTNVPHNEDHEEIVPGSIRKHVEADMRMAYPGKPTSRKRIFKSGLKDKAKPHLISNESDHDNEEDASVNEDSDHSSAQDDNAEGSEDEVDSNDEDDDNEGNSEDEFDSNDDVDNEEDSEDGDNSSDYGGSITGFGDDSKL